MVKARIARCPGGAIVSVNALESPQVVEALTRSTPPHARHRPDPATWVIVNPHADAARWLVGEWAEVEVVEADSYAAALAAVTGGGVR